MTQEWTCRACCTRSGERFNYPPGPDVFCARCGRPLGWLAEVLRALLHQVEGHAIEAPTTVRPPTANFLLTVEDVAEFLSTSRKGVYAQVARGQLPGVVWVGHRMLFRPEPLHQWLHGKRRSPPPLALPRVAAEPSPGLPLFIRDGTRPAQGGRGAAPHYTSPPWHRGPAHAARTVRRPTALGHRTQASNATSILEAVETSSRHDAVLRVEPRQDE